MLLRLKFTLLTISCFVLAWFAQNDFVFNTDVSWLLHASSSMLHGGSYRQNFYETNPPLILYLYAPVFLLMKVLSVSIFSSTRIYVFILSIISLSLCRSLMKQIFPPEDTQYPILLLALLAFTFLILPLADFGQREHLTTILTMPYFFLMYLRLTPTKDVPFPQSVLIGFFAVLGFSLKPFFFIPLLLLEIRQIYCRKQWKACIRPETIVIALFLLLYAILILTRHQDYLTFIVPIAAHFYYQTYAQPMLSMLIYERSTFFYLLVLYHYLTYANNPYKLLSNTLLIASFGCWLSFVLQRITWYYHSLPVFSLNILLLGFLIAIQCRQANKRLALLGCIIAIMPLVSVIEDFYYNAVYQGVYRHLILDTKQYAGQSVYFFTYDSEFAFPLINYSNLNYVSRFWSFAWLPMVDDNQAKNAYANLYSQHKTQLNFYIKNIVDDFANHKPELVFVDARYKNENLYIGGMQMNYLRLFSFDASFMQTWQHYHKINTIAYPPLYEFDIYKRDG